MSEEASISPIIKQNEQEQLEKKQQAFQYRQQELQQKLQDLGRETDEKSLLKLKKAIEIVANRKKINYVLAETQTLFYGGGIEITMEVMAELLRIDATEAPVKK